MPVGAMALAAGAAARLTLTMSGVVGKVALAAPSVPCSLPALPSVSSEPSLPSLPSLPTRPPAADGRTDGRTDDLASVGGHEDAAGGAPPALRGPARPVLPPVRAGKPVRDSR